MKRKLLCLILAATMVFSFAVPAMAYNTKDFVDVPKGNWAYDAVMKMADAGVINGVGGGKFDPNGQVTAEQFITLVGRIVFPEVKASGSDWSGPYVTEAKAKGMLTGTTVTDGSLKSAITRYDMAVILRSAAKLLEAEEKLAEPSAIGDYGMTPTMYADAVRAVYGMGLITGDDKHNFNGQNSMRRSEAATVMSRLIALKLDNPTTDPGTTKTDRPIDPEAKYTDLLEAGCHPRADYDPSTVERYEGKRTEIDMGFLTDKIKGKYLSNYVYLKVGETYQFTVGEVPAGYGYADGNLNERVQSLLDEMDPDWNYLLIERLRKGIWSSRNEEVVKVDNNGVVTAVGPGETDIEVVLPVLYYNKIWMESTGLVTICVDP